MTTADDVPAHNSAEVMQAFVHLRLGIAAVDRLLHRSGPCPGHLQLTMILTEMIQATHHALVRLTEAKEIMGNCGCGESIPVTPPAGTRG